MKIKYALITVFIFFTAQINSAKNDIDLTELPGIYIERSVDNSQLLIPGLQEQYNLCIATKQSRQEAMQKYPYIWESMKETIEPGYDVQAAAQPEPDWEKLAVGRFREEEFFYRNKYAFYSYQAKYAISEDGLCKLLITDVEKQDLDNGEYRYLVMLEDRVSSNNLAAGGSSKVKQFRRHRIERMPSPLVGRQ